MNTVSIRRVRPKQSGFTLLEILLVVAILSLLMGIVIVAINPSYQLAQARDAQRRSDVGEISKAIQQYYLDHKDYPVRPKNDILVYEICNTRASMSGDACIGFINLSKIIPTYLTSIPIDPVVKKTLGGSGYNLAISPVTGVYVEAQNTEVGNSQGKDQNSLVIYNGRPPTGYSIPTVSVPEVKNTFTQRISQSVVTLVQNSTDWFKIVGIFSIIVFVIGYFIQRRYFRSHRSAGSSLLN